MRTLRDDLESREAEIIRLLSSVLQPKKVFVVIGGYAVSALATHRFSVDCDVVIPKELANEFAAVVTKEGYQKKRSATGFDKTYGSEVEIYTKLMGSAAAQVSLDLFIDAVTSRKTGASWSYEYLHNNSIQAIVSGVKSSAAINVPKKELLIAMKIHSGRDVDMRDIVLLSGGTDWSQVFTHANRGEKNTLAKHLTDIIAITGRQQFTQSLRATFSLRNNIDSLITECRSGLSKLRGDIEFNSDRA